MSKMQTHRDVGTRMARKAEKMRPSTLFIAISAFFFTLAGIAYQLGYDPANLIQASKILALYAIAASIQERPRK